MRVGDSSAAGANPTWLKALLRGSPAPILLLLLLTGLLSTYWIYDRSMVEQSLREEVDVANTRRISQSLAAFRTLYTSEVVQRLQDKGLEITHDYVDREDAIPLPATMTKLLGDEISRGGADVTVRLYSEYPFRPRGWELDAWEREALARLEVDPGEPVWATTTIGETPVIRFATADLMRESCVRCHNTHAASPKRDWRVGDVRGVLEVIVPVAHGPESGGGMTSPVVLGLSALWLLVTGLLLGLQRSNRRLARAREQAEAANTAKSEFLANMSHEIRTPMNAVIGMTGLLLETPLSAQQRSFAEVVRGSGEALLRLLNDILDFSKIEAGELEVERVPVNLRECVEGALELVSAVAADKGLELAVDVARDVPVALYGDSTRLQQVLVNLVSNAVKFTESGEIVVTLSLAVASSDARAPASGVECAEGEGEGASVELHCSVRDTGIGIRPEALPKLFAAFQQGDNSTTRRFGGTGLGLAICRRLVEAMGGRIWIESELGVGSTFHFTIRGELAPSEAPDYLTDEHKPLLRRSALVADDNGTNRTILRHHLEAWGMRVEAYASGVEVLARLDEDDVAFDCAILDMHMPGMNGVALAESIHGREELRELPLVMLSSLGERKSDGSRRHFRAVLQKPLKPSRLYNVLLGLFVGVREPHEGAGMRAPEVSEVDGALRSMRILLAEDNAINQRVALLSLERLGLRTDAVADGVEAIAALRARPYDVVLMDLNMPVLDGLEATREIRADKTLSQPYIIAVTANATVQDRERCLVAGMDDYLSKPYRPGDLRRVLTRYGRVFRETRDVAKRAVRAVPLSTVSRERPLDPEALTRLASPLAAGERPLLATLVDGLLPEVAGLLEATREAHRSGDEEGRRFAAHTLKSKCESLGALELAALARRLEEDESLGAEDVAAGVVALEGAHRRFLAALDRVRASW